jgi:hypothetical protein
MPRVDPALAMIRRGFAIALCAVAFTGCASQVVGMGDSSPPDAHTSREASVPDVQDAPPDIPYRDVPREYDVYHEDACITDVPPGQRMYNCDPYATPTTCPMGQSCYVYIDYPMGSCGMEIYRSDCFMTGTTPPDGFCTTATDCQPGFGCFITGSSNRCLSLCRLDGTPPQCSMGRVCQVTDLPDYGACD